MVRALRGGLRQYAVPLRYRMLRTLVTWFVPAAIQFDEADPLLGGGLMGVGDSAR